MQPTNPFPQLNIYIDLHKYEGFLNGELEKVYEEVFKDFESVEVSLIKEAFWDLADLKNFDPSNWYHYFAVAFIRNLGFDVLYKEGRIKEITLDLHKLWIDYLLKRIIPHMSLIHNEFLIKQYSEYAYTREDEFRELIIEGADFINEIDLLKLLDDSQISVVTKVRKFKESFLNFYEIFLERCSLYGYEMSKYEGNKNSGRWGRNIPQIFYLSGDHLLTPPTLIEEKLHEFRHIRNSFSHSWYSIRNDSQINFKDQDWEENYDLSELWLVYYHLMLFDRDFPCMALSLFALRWLSTE